MRNRLRTNNYPDSKVHGANMGPIWDRQGPGGPHDGPMNFATGYATDYRFFNLYVGHFCLSYSDFSRDSARVKLTLN